MGVVFSLGSSSLVGNVISGFSMTYRRTFHVGDIVRIGEHLGGVREMRLLVTHLRTPKNEEVIVPNSGIVGTEVVNYSSIAREGGLILHTTVGIGYETPWRQVEAMLMEAAARTPGLLGDRPPFVHLLSLGDFCVQYEINVYCDTPQQMRHLLLGPAPQHPRRLQRVRRADHDARLRGGPGAAEGRAEGTLVRGTCECAGAGRARCGPNAIARYGTRGMGAYRLADCRNRRAVCSSGRS